MNSDRILWIALGVIGVGLILLMLNNDAGATFGVDNDRFASLIWLSTIALVIGTTLFSRGLPAGHILRTAAMWLCVFLLVMVLYRVLASYDMLPENFRDRPIIPNSGEGVNASLAVTAPTSS